MTLCFEALMALPLLTIGLAWFLHEREHHVLSRRPTTGKHRRERVRETRTSA